MIKPFVSKAAGALARAAYALVGEHGKGPRTPLTDGLIILFRVPPPPYRIRWLGNSLRSNSSRREADSVRRLRRAQRKDPSSMQKMKKQPYITIDCHFEQSEKSPPSVEREISPKGRNDKGGAEVTEGKTWIPDYQCRE